MNSFEEKLIMECGNLLKELEQFKKQINYGIDSKKRSEQIKVQYSAMLSDICEVIFGGNANGAPAVLSICHAGWACGPSSKPSNKTYLECFYEMQKSPLTPIGIIEWKNFLNKLKVVKNG